MADTLDEIAYNLKNTIEGGRSHHNTYYSLDQIKFNIENYRALFIRRDIRDSHDLRNFEQKLLNSVTRLAQYVTPDGAIKYALRTDKEIPRLMRLKHQYPLTVSDSDRRVIYPVGDSAWNYWQVFNKYTSVSPRCYMLDGFLYIEGDAVSRVLSQIDGEQETFPADIAELEIRGVFERPSEVMIFNGVDPIDVGSQEYPITKDMTQRITEGLINGELQMMMQTLSDTKHNTGPDHQLMR